MELISLFFTALPFAVAFALSITVVLLLFGATRSMLVGVGLVVVTFVFSTMAGASGLRLGLNLSIADLSLSLLGASFGFRLIAGHFHWREPVSRAWLLLGLVWFVMFAVGLRQNGSSAGVAFRGSFYLWVTVAYLLSFQPTAKVVQQSLSVFGIGLLGLLILIGYRWGVLATGNYDGEGWRESATSFRVVSAQATQGLALMLAVCVAGWTRLSDSRPWWSVLGIVSLPFVLVLQHRTVWLACLSVLVAALLLGLLKKRARISGVLLLMLGFALILLVLFALMPRSAVTASLGESTTTNTLVWRIDSWQSLLSLWLQGGPATWLAGKPFGASLTRFVEASGQQTSVSAHSHYISLLMNGGLLALAAYAWAVYKTFLGLWSGLQRSNLAAGPDVTAALMLSLVAISVFAGAYNIDYVQGLLLGLAMSSVRSVPTATPSTAASAVRQRARPARPLLMRGFK